MSSQSLPSEPGTDDLAGLFSTPNDQVESTIATNFTDDLDALHEQETELKQSKTQAGVVVQHRSWSTQEIFRSEPQRLSSSPDNKMAPMPFITSSPPPTPSPPKKRKFADLDLGQNQLARPQKAQRVYYGINIHQLLEEAQLEQDLPKSVQELPTPPAEQAATSKRSSLLWTEKYRARKFTDLIGDERTHRAVMHWLKRWDALVFPGSQNRLKSKSRGPENTNEEKQHKKILMLTGPPGLGKTTLAHVCAKQAGYEVQEINASDERSGSVVKGRIRDMVGTENVRGVDSKTADGNTKRKAGKPVCVIIDEVDGVVSGASGSGGEGGFIKALIDLIALDQKNSANSALSVLQQAPTQRKKRGERFRLMRPMILICNDVYHPSLRPLRQSSHAEVIHVRKAPVQILVPRLQAIFDREGVPCETDGVRRLCEATWGVSNRREEGAKSGGAGEGDMRGIMVVGEWVARKLKASTESAGSNAKLTRKWVEDNVLNDLAHGGGAARGLGRGGPKDIVERVFQEGAGFPKSTLTTAAVTPQHQTANSSATGGVIGVAEAAKRTSSARLRELVESNHGDTDRILTDCFTSYPTRAFQDDTLLSKPEAVYEWLHFHDSLSSAVFSSSEWELAPYLSTPVLGFHHLFASPTRALYTHAQEDDSKGSTETEDAHPFTGPQASWAAHEAEKQNTSTLQTLQSSLSLELSRLFPSPAPIGMELLPYVLRMLSPNINPVIVGGSDKEKGTASVRRASEQLLVQRAVQAMGASGVRFERVKVNPFFDQPSAVSGSAQWIYRMEPALDELGTFETGGKAFGSGASGSVQKTRYAVRQVLEQEWRKEDKRLAEVAHAARFRGSRGGDEPTSAEHHETDDRSEESTSKASMSAVTAIKRDFFGRPIADSRPNSSSSNTGGVKQNGKGVQHNAGETGGERRVWVTYHEGFSNAVRKPITLAELMKDL